MKDNTHEEKLAIARLAYKQIKSVIDSFENRQDFSIGCCWDACIRVEDELFHESELMDGA